MDCLSEASSLGLLRPRNSKQPERTASATAAPPAAGHGDSAAFVEAFSRSCSLQGSLQGLINALPIADLDDPARQAEDVRLLHQATSVLSTIESDRRQLVSSLQGLSSRATVAVEPLGQAALLQLLRCAAADGQLLAQGQVDAAWAQQSRLPPSAWAEQLQPLLEALQALQGHHDAQLKFRIAQKA